MNAKPLNTYKGRHYWKFPVRIEYGERASITQNPEDMRKGIIWVISDSAREAGYCVRELLYGVPCIELTVLGPRGGVAWHSYRGWESAIFEQMCKRADHKYIQLRLGGL